MSTKMQSNLVFVGIEFIILIATLYLSIYFPFFEIIYSYFGLDWTSLLASPNMSPIIFVFLFISPFALSFIAYASVLTILWHYLFKSFEKQTTSEIKHRESSKQ